MYLKSHTAARSHIYIYQSNTVIQSNYNQTEKKNQLNVSENSFVFSLVLKQVTVGDVLMSSESWLQSLAESYFHHSLILQRDELTQN